MSPIINELDLQYAIGKVRRDRARERELEIWTEFCSQQLYRTTTSSEREQVKVNGSPIRTQPSDEEENKSIWPPPLLLTSRRNNLVETVIYDSQDEIPTHIENLTEIKETIEFEPQLNSASTRSLKDICTERNFGTAQKLKSVCFKIIEILNSMKSNLMNFQIPEEAAEMIRIQKKSNEFCSRFSRNHLYHFELQVKEIRALNLCEPYTEWDEYTHHLHQILNVYQILLQAYSMFQRHMWLIWGLGDTIIKLYALVKGTIELNRVSSPHQDSLDITKSLQELNQSCLYVKESLSEILDKCSSDKDFTYMKSQTSSPKNLIPQLAGKGIDNTLRCHCHQKLDKINFKVNSINQHEITSRSIASADRYSMYRSKSGNKVVKNSKSSLSNGRLQSNASKIATQNINTIRKPKIPVVSSYINSEIINKTGIIHGRSNIRNKNRGDLCVDTKTKVSASAKHENILVTAPTAIIGSKSKEARNFKSINSRVKYRRADVENPDTLVTQLTNSSRTSKICDESDTGLPLLQVRDGATSFAVAAGNYSDARADGVGGSVGGASREVSPSPRLLADFPGGAGAGGPPTRTSSGPADQRNSKIKNKSNVQLLVLSHDDLAIQPKEDCKSSLVRNTPQKNTSKTERSQKNDENDDRHTNIALNCENPTKLKIPQATRDAFMDYRLNFIQYMMDNPMYTSCNSQRKPWEAVTRISERLITDVLDNISQEMEMEDLLKHLVGLELDIVAK